MQELQNLQLTNIDNTEDVFKHNNVEKDGEHLKKGETEGLDSKIKFRSSGSKNSNTTTKQTSQKHHHHKRGRSSKDSRDDLKQKVGARKKKKCHPSECKQNRFHVKSE